MSNPLSMSLAELADWYYTTADLGEDGDEDRPDAQCQVARYTLQARLGQHGREAGEEHRRQGKPDPSFHASTRPVIRSSRLSRC